jgi:hypothetical protein
MAEPSRRLDSWKDVAEYLGRDVRTAMRWAKADGLPVRRVAGGRGRSVFAYTNEIDAWLAGGAVVSTSPAPEPRRSPVALGGAVVAVLASAMAIALWFYGSSAQGASLSVTTTDDGVVLHTGGGSVRHLHRFDPELVPVFTPAPPTVEGQGAGALDVLVGVSSYLDRRQRGARNGELLHLSKTGRVHWRFGFDDVLEFPGERFQGPWGLTDWSVSPASASPRIAVAAHHETWWPSMATVIDADARRLATFVNPGWIESLLWIDERRLAAAGFANQRDAAMLAIVDTHEPQSVAPGTSGTPFACTSCSGPAPLMYVTFPRSELNQLTAGRFNRARIVRQNDRFVVTTVELAGDPVSATAIYEFDTEFRLISARYDDVYWTLHQQLEREGRLAHTRARCPQANGPVGMQVWHADRWVPLTARSPSS